MDLLNITQKHDDWYLWYGITRRRKDSLARCPSHPGSFFHARNEFPLTLFMLGNIDRWKQVDNLPEKPRKNDDNSSLSRSFFKRERNYFIDTEENNLETSLWASPYISKKIGLKKEPSKEPLLLFELEGASLALHRENRESRNSISFLDVSDKRRWVRYDAVLMFPSEKLFVFFEAKHRADTDMTRKDPAKVGQIVKGLESAYLLTEHEDSVYCDWDFQYVVIFPKILDEYGLTSYRNVVDDLGEHLVRYNDLLNKVSKEDINEKTYPDYFGNFVKKATKRVSKLYWNELGEALKIEDENFLESYFKRLEKLNLSIKRVKNIQRKLREVGIKP